MFDIDALKYCTLVLIVVFQRCLMFKIRVIEVEKQMVNDSVLV